MSRVLRACYIVVKSVQRAERHRFGVRGGPASAVEDQQRDRYDERRRDQQGGCEMAAFRNPGRGRFSRIGELSKPIALRQIASMKFLDIALERLDEQVACAAVGAF